MGKPNENLTELIYYLNDRINENTGGGDSSVTDWSFQTGILITEESALEILEKLKILNSDAFQETKEIQNIFFRIIKEFSKARKAHPETDNFDINKLTLVMTEEAGEVAKAVLQYQDEDGEMEDVRSELIQTAAMCVRMLLATKDYKPKYK